MISLQCEFWAVGQGLFSSGKVICDGKPDFTWVYDCGAKPHPKSQQTPELDLAITNMNYKYGEIDLLAISHFDEDHINGIAKLLSARSKVKYLLLPYYPLWQRLIIAKYAGVKSDDPIFSFYVNPVRYVLDTLKVETILLLPSYQNDNVSIIKDTNSEHSFSLVSSYSNEFDNIQQNKVKWLDPSKPLIFNQAEFVAYNVPFNNLSVRPRNKAVFQQQVTALVNQSPLNVVQLRQLYDSYFVTKSNKARNRNVISIFLYVSILNKNSNRGIYYTETKNNQVRMLFANNAWNSFMNNNEYKDAILYGGDGYLNSHKSLRSLCSTLGYQRINRIACFQVVHHGSKSNWKVGFSKTIQPNLSVFSADPTLSYNHPSSLVVFDLMPYNPILVDKTNTLEITIN